MYQGSDEIPIEWESDLITVSDEELDSGNTANPSAEGSTQVRFNFSSSMKITIFRKERRGLASPW
jgi:hypothetical protein